MNKNKKIIIASVIMVSIVFITGIVLALFTSRQEDNARINIGNLDVILIENWDNKDVPETGIELNSKTVKGESVAQKRAYVRMRFIPVVEYFVEEENGTQINEWRTAPVTNENINLNVNTNDNWIKQGEYYYYKNILEPEETTEEMNLSWQIIELPSVLSNYSKIRTDVRVLLEYSQVSNDIWKNVFQIDNLPEGVERVEVTNGEI